MRFLPAEEPVNAGLRLLASLLLLGGCGVGSRLTADRKDYTLYRETRVGATPEQRLAASGRYLKELPNGRFRSEVERQFAQTEPRFFAQAHDRPSLLRAYLRALPDGPHAKDASARLEEFGLLNKFRARHQAASESFVQRVESELVSAERGRQSVVREVSTLVSLMARTRSFGAPTSELDDELIYRFRLSPPAGTCAESRCAKSFHFGYAVPEAGKLAPRALDIVLSFELDRGNVTSISLAGRDLFTRLAEAMDRIAISSSDQLARMEAIARAVQLVDNATSSAFPDPGCRKDVIAPVVLARECGGVRLLVRAAIEPGEDDRVEVMATAFAKRP
jgi:hypothetical protein